MLRRGRHKGGVFISLLLPQIYVLSGATMEGHNLWKEVEDGMWDVIEMGPKMIQMAPVAHLLQSERFCERLGFMFIDEVHLIDEWGCTFRKEFL